MFVNGGAVGSWRTVLGAGLHYLLCLTQGLLVVADVVSPAGP